MAGDGNPSRQPAAKVEGQRRRLTRVPPRNAVPRSQTLPILEAGSEADGPYADSEPESHEAATASHAQEGANTLPASRSMANFYPPTGGIPADLRPRDHSPALTAGSASSAAIDIKKKHGLRSVHTSRKQTPHMTSPLPPATPTKAQRVLGTLDESMFQDIVTDDENEAPKPTGFWGSSMKTAKKMIGLVETGRPMQYAPELNDRQDSEDVAHRHRSHPKTVNKHLAQKDRIDRMTPITEASHDSLSTAYHVGESSPELDVIEEYTDYYRPYSSHAIPQRVESLIPIAPNRLYQLDPDDMSPVDDESERRTELAGEREEFDAHPGTLVNIETQHSESVRRRSPLQAIEDGFLDVAEAELEAKERASKLRAEERVAELEAKKYAAELEVKKYEAELKVLKYAAELEAARLGKAKEEGSTEEDVAAVHGTPMALSKAKPLPAIQDRHLTPFEIELEKLRQGCDAHDATKKAMDAEVAAMYLKHQDFKKEFEPFAALVKGASGVGEVEEDDDDDADLVSIRSSIDLDEEPTLHVATAMTITRITPGMVKLIDIPARKGKKKQG